MPAQTRHTGGCDGRLALFARPEDTSEAGVGSSDAGTTMALVSIDVYPSAAHVTVRVLRGATVVREASFAPSYRDKELEAACITCRQADPVTM